MNLFATFMCSIGLTLSTLTIAQELEKGFVAVPSVETVKAKTDAWVSARSIADNAKLMAIEALWVSMDGDPLPKGSLLGRVVQTFAIADAKTEAFLATLVLGSEPKEFTMPKDLFENKGLGSFYEANLRVHIGRYLVHQAMYEEALDVLASVPLSETVDPAGLLFYRATCQHALSKVLNIKEDALKTMEVLISGVEGAPLRYINVAQQMKAELEQLEDKSLDHVANLMGDTTRRLGLGRAGQKTQAIEKDIVALLDEMIKNEEDKMTGGGAGQGQGKAGSAKNKKNASSSPAGDSQVKGATAAGEVDKKRMKPGAAWGSINEKERVKVKNLISRDFPAHYRATIEAYFKKLAERDSK